MVKDPCGVGHWAGEKAVYYDALLSNHCDPSVCGVLRWHEDARRRAGLGPGERGNSEILLDDMADYYGGLDAR